MRATGLAQLKVPVVQEIQLIPKRTKLGKQESAIYDVEQVAALIGHCMQFEVIKE